MEQDFPFEPGDPFEGLRLGEGGKRGIEFECLDFCPICRTADVLRATMPEEFRGHLHNLQREGLLAMRALIDGYIQHLERQQTGSTAVEDIPIE